MTSWVRSLVCVMWHDTCAGCQSRLPRYENTGRGSSPGWGSEPGEVDGAPVDAGRRAGLEASDRELALAKLARQRVRGWVAGPASLLILEPHVDASAEEGADGHHHARGLDAGADAGHHAAHRVTLDEQIGDRLLEQREPGRVLQHPADVAAVERAVDLGAGRPHRRALAGVEGPEVNPAMVGGHRHRAAQRVDLLDEVPLADPADGRVAAHLPERLDALGEQQGLGARPGRGERRLGAGVAAADDDDVECAVVEHGDGGRFRGRGGVGADRSRLRSRCIVADLAAHTGASHSGGVHRCGNGIAAIRPAPATEPRLRSADPGDRPRRRKRPQAWPGTCRVPVVGLPSTCALAAGESSSTGGRQAGTEQWT